jgi:hypothetical protein
MSNNNHDENPLGILTVGDFFAQIVPVRKYYWEGILPMDSLALFHGQPKAGKTTFVYSLIKAIVNGDNAFLGHGIRKAKVLILALEESPFSIKTRLRKIGITADSNLFIYNAPLISAPSTYDGLAKYIKANDIEIIVVDILMNFIAVDTENDNSQVERALEPLRQFARLHKLTIILIHHSGKNAEGDDPVKNVRGASALAGKADFIFSLIKKGGSNKNRRVLNIDGRYDDSPPEPMDIEYIPETGEFFSVREDDLLTRVYPKLDEFRTLDWLLEECSPVKEKALREVLKLGVENGTIIKTGTGHKGDPSKWKRAQ